MDYTGFGISVAANEETKAQGLNYLAILSLLYIWLLYFELLPVLIGTWSSTIKALRLRIPV